jgi:diguanylate cyclase (GGDEF)-like protein
MSEIDYTHSKILIVDDNPGDIDVLLELLKHFDVRAVLDGVSALETIEEEPPDLILLDITMPGMDGFEVCQALKANPKTANIPIIFLSIRTDVENIVTGFELGGVDYITKPYLPKETIARIQTHLKLQHAIKELKLLANTDPLTGIANRRSFFLEATETFESAKKEQLPLHLFLIDIDNFKMVNDNYGHAIGDQVMRGFVEEVQKLLHPVKHFARLGGDEFVVILEDVEQTEAWHKLDRLREDINKHHLVKESPVLFTISVGMATLDDTMQDIDALLLKADINLYRSKQTKNAIN